jgi:hypothetical protein
MIEIALIVIWNVGYALIEGYREAYYYHAAMLLGDKLKKEMHPVFSIQRILFFSVALIFFKWYIAICVFMGEIFTFSFFHNGMYYLTRNNLSKEVYEKRWRAESSTSTAKLEFTWMARLVLLIVGISFYIATICLFYTIQ